MWVCLCMFVMNNGALRAVKKPYIRLCAARDRMYLSYLSFALAVNRRLFSAPGTPLLALAKNRIEWCSFVCFMAAKWAQNER
jgi:hypothetical protein